VPLTFFVFEGNSITEDGDYSGLWVSGNLVYLGVVLVANMEILCCLTMHSVFSSLIILLSVLAFIVYYWFESMISVIPELYGTFSFMWSAP